MDNMGPSHRCCIMRKVICKELTAGRKFDFSGLCFRMIMIHRSNRFYGVVEAIPFK